MKQRAGPQEQDARDDDYPDGIVDLRPEAGIGAQGEKHQEDHERRRVRPGRVSGGQALDHERSLVDLRQSLIDLLLLVRLGLTEQGRLELLLRLKLVPFLEQGKSAVVTEG